MLKTQHSSKVLNHNQNQVDYQLIHRCAKKKTEVRGAE